MTGLFNFVKLIKNPDLPDIFKKPKYKIISNDITFEKVWYLDKKYFSSDEIWVYKLLTCENPNEVKHMGFIKPEISDILDVVFISYDEENADQHWNKLLKIAPNSKRVHGVKGIFEAHKQAALIASSDMFWIVDGDADILDSWNFDFQPTIFDRDCIHIWKSKNPINDLVYGYGGIKLFPRSLLVSATTWNLDVATSVGNKIKLVDEVSNITSFNSSPFSTWRSAFRECAKLSSKIIKNQNDQETDDRLSIWLTKGKHKLYGNYAIAGAKSGKDYGIENAKFSKLMKLINDREWLLQKFNKEKIYESNYL
jgi:hypothetical protein